MCLRVLLWLMILAVVAPFSSEAQPPIKDIVLDLALQGEEETRIERRGHRFRLRLENLLPSAAYETKIVARPITIDPLSTSVFSVGGQPLQDLQSKTKKAAEELVQGGDPCADLTAAFVVDAFEKTSEEQIKALIVTTRARAAAMGGTCPDSLDHAIVELTTRQLGPTMPLRREQELVITIARQGGSARTWTLALTTDRGGEWRVMYGFTFVPNQDRKFSTVAEPETSRFRIVEQNDREDLDFLPSIFFSWFGGGGPHGLVAGLGYDVDDPALFAGYGYRYRQNIMLTAGIAIHKRTDLAGRFDVDQLIGEQLDADQLGEESFEPNVFFGVGFRFGSNIFAQRDQTKRAIAQAKKDAAQAAAEKEAQATARKKKEEARLDECLKKVELDLAEEKKECGNEQACVGIAEKRAEHGRATCKRESIERSASGA